jgi:hypothetical protein
MTRQERLKRLARIGLLAFERYRTWRAFGGYDGPLAPNAMMEELQREIRRSEWSMKDLDDAHRELDESAG